MIDPKGGKICMAHDCGAFGLKQRAEAISPAPRNGAKGSARANQRHMPGGKP